MTKPVDVNVSPRGVLKRLRAACPGYEFKTSGPYNGVYIRLSFTKRWDYIGVWNNEPKLFEYLRLCRIVKGAAK